MSLSMMLMLAASNIPAGPAPIISAATVSQSFGGACSGPPGNTVTSPATVLISWSIANPDAANYKTLLFKNGVQIASGANTITSVTVPYSGYVSYTGGPAGHGGYTSSDVYRLDVYRNADGVIVSTTTAATWINRYGLCGF